MAASRYTLIRIGDSTDPCGSPISASMYCPPMVIVDCWLRSMIRSTIPLSLGD
jgi:hypothetical protein